MLYAVTDRSWLGGHTLAWQVEQSLLGGVTMVQLREKALSKDAFFAEGLEIKALCQAYGAPFLINDDVELAIALGADGVHVGQEDGCVAQIRQRIGQDMILGVSAQTVAQAVQAQRDGADYLGVGAVFPTGTKPDAATLSPAVVGEICAQVEIPVVAIGGITQENLPQLVGSGVCGVAVISALYAQPDIQEAARTLLNLCQRLVTA